MPFLILIIALNLGFLNLAGATAPACPVAVGPDPIDAQFIELGELRELVHSAVAKGSSSIEISVLKASYQKTEKNLFEQLHRAQNLTRDEFNERLNKSIAKVKEQQGAKEIEIQQERQREIEKVRERERRAVVASQEILTQIDSIANMALFIENYPPNDHKQPWFQKTYKEGLDKIFQIIAEENLDFTEERIMTLVNEAKNDPNRLPNLRRR